jgi:hypothetical protein
MFITPFLCIAQNGTGELKGTVRYPAANGQRACDVGAEVIIYLIDSTRPSPEKYRKQHEEDSILNNSFLATIYYSEWEHTPIHKTQKEMARKLKALDAYPEEKLNDLDNLAATIIKGRENKQCAKTTIDNNCNYSVKLHAGYYGIIFRSRHLHSHSKTESSGDIKLDAVWIKPGETTSKNEEML